MIRGGGAVWGQMVRREEHDKKKTHTNTSIVTLTNLLYS